MHSIIFLLISDIWMYLNIFKPVLKYVQMCFKLYMIAVSKILFIFINFQSGPKQDNYLIDPLHFFFLIIDFPDNMKRNPLDYM